MGEIANIIKQKLTTGLAPTRLDLLDQSASHAGHHGHDGRGESHFKLTVVSEKFAGLSRIDRHRLVNEILKEELKERVHALTIKALAPDETG